LQSGVHWTQMVMKRDGYAEAVQRSNQLAASASMTSGANGMNSVRAQALVEPVHHRRVGGLGEDAAVPERARPVFHAALEDADHLLGGERVADRVGGIVEACDT
jgi:hypothetical protein